MKTLNIINASDNNIMHHKSATDNIICNLYKNKIFNAMLRKENVINYQKTIKMIQRN